MKEITTAIISDIHFGASSPIKLFEELRFFISYIQSLSSLDLIVIDGDYFDSKLYVQSNATKLAVYFMNLLITTAKMKNTKIRIVYGTESHDAMQYNIFSMYETDSNCDFRIIYKVEEEEIFQDVWVLYLPEEYIHDKHQYYDEYLMKKNRYDYIFGHGVIKEGMTMVSRNKQDEKKRLKTPIFSTAEFQNCCVGKVYFGHYHVYTNIDDFVYYVGSYSRWSHGEEEEKGFIIDTMKENRKHKTEFIENADAPIYRTYVFGYRDDIFQNEEATVKHLQTLQNMVDDDSIHKVRFVFNIPETYENPEFFIQCVKNKFSLSKKVSLLFSNGYIESRKAKNEEILDTIISKYEYILDKSMSMENIVQEFIKDRKDKFLDVEDIQRYLYGTPVDDIRKKLDT